MKQRIITAIVLIAIMLPCTIIGYKPFMILVAILTCGACFEILSICESPKTPIYFYAVTGFYMLYTVLFGRELLIESSSIIILLIIILALSIFDEQIPIIRASYYFLSIVLISGGFHALYYVRMQLGLSYILYLALATFGSDTGAYFAGVLFGKHKLIPRLSPKKTIEGSIGGIVLGTILSVVYAYYFKLPYSLIQLSIISIILTMTSQIGDLTFSSFKRYFNVKDYSQIFPGHGGVLDRFDSLLFNALVLCVCLSLTTMVL